MNGVVGAGIFALPSAMARDAGAWAPWSFAICAIAMAAVVICFAEAGSRVPTSGGPYGIVAEALGPGAGFLSGLMLWMSSVVACGGIAAALADSVGALVPGTGGSFARSVIIVSAIGAIAAVNLTGVRAGARLAASMTMVKIVPLLVFVVAGSLALLSAPVHAAPLPSSHAYGHALILAVFAMCGMETVLGASGEVANPARTLPRALVRRHAVRGGALRRHSDHSPRAARPVARRFGNAVGRCDGRVQQADCALLLLAGAAMSMFGWIASDILGAPRILFAFARDNMLPAVFGRVHRIAAKCRMSPSACTRHWRQAWRSPAASSRLPPCPRCTRHRLYILVCASAFSPAAAQRRHGRPEPLAFRDRAVLRGARHCQHGGTLPGGRLARDRRPAGNGGGGSSHFTWLDAGGSQPWRGLMQALRQGARLWISAHYGAAAPRSAPLQGPPRP